ncbi:EAL domain-containing protein [Fulvimarina sp. 2208YS6-2-32]|uniref:EAL domain-containing protein n=1 Tax=Fulvimarina uroteuthidis TaxID=3098149 RepID=A0ABU5I0G6_9HYPH|nr:EAL domain-containing protein [Fulvimarina sp. 2208YS6-2-32]MDY8107661.1 EAL domain-containing protein [Fulvimarina sp. 2208YS6-2-32]
MSDTVLNENVQAELALPWYAGRRRELVRLYDERREASRRSATRYTMWVAVIIYTGFALADYFLIYDVFVLTVLVRFTFGALTLAVTEFMFRSRSSADMIDDICGLAIIACYAAWLFSATQTADVLALSYYLVYGALFMMVASLFFDFPIPIALRTCLAILAGGLVSVYWIPQPMENYGLAFAIFYFGCFAAVSYVNWKLDRERYYVFLNALKAEIGQREVEKRGNDLLMLSRTDPLTGLFNRRATDEKLARFWQGWLQSEQSFAILLIDVDYFKPYNDHYGHQNGDECLVRLADVFSSIARSRDCATGRYGGEEFIFIMPTDDLPSVIELAETIRTSVERLGLLHDMRPDGRKAVTISIGAAVCHSSQSDTIEALIHEADRALYRAKDQGRNRIEIFDPSHLSRQHGGEDIAALLEKAIDTGLVSLVYQPVVDLRTGRTVALEALMRLERPDGGTIGPNIFIPIAESTGQIVSIGRWALLTACRDVLVADRAPIVSVNISIVQLKTPGFALYTAALLGRLKINPARLALEIRRSQAIEEFPEALGALAELRKIGVKIWLDDFGTVSSGLSWLKARNFDSIKIDRSFLAETMNARDRTILSDLIRMVRHRGNDVIIAGVETEKQVELLKTYDVAYAQGFQFHRPASLAALEASGAIDAAAPTEEPRIDRAKTR